LQDSHPFCRSEVLFRFGTSPTPPPQLGGGFPQAFIQTFPALIIAAILPFSPVAFLTFETAMCFLFKFIPATQLAFVFFFFFARVTGPLRAAGKIAELLFRSPLVSFLLFVLDEVSLLLSLPWHEVCILRFSLWWLCELILSEYGASLSVLRILNFYLFGAVLRRCPSVLPLALVPRILMPARFLRS